MRCRDARYNISSRASIGSPVKHRIVELVYLNGGSLHQQSSNTNSECHDHSSAGGQTDSRPSVGCKRRTGCGSIGSRTRSGSSVGPRSSNSSDGLEKCWSRRVGHGVSFESNTGERQLSDCGSAGEGDSFGCCSGGLEGCTVEFARNKDTAMFGSTNVRMREE